MIFVIRTRGSPFRSRPHPLLALTSIGVVTLAIALPLTPLGLYFGFVAPPWRFYLIVLAMVALYLVMVQLAKAVFYRWVSRTPALTRSR